MKKIFVKIVSNDNWFDWESWYNEEDAETDHIYIGGNRDFGTVNEGLYNTTKTKLEDAYYDIGVVRDEGYTGQELVEEVYKIIRGYFKYSDGTTLISPDCLTLLQLIKEFSYCYRTQEEYKLVAEVLSILYKENFITGTFHGYSQGDWQDYICPESLKPRLSYIEAVYMGTGTLLEISDDKYETLEEAEEAANYYTDYVADLYSNEDIKNYVAEQLGIGADEVVVVEE